MAKKYFANHNREGDENEPAFDGKTVTLIPEIKAACDAVIETGLTETPRRFLPRRHPRTAELQADGTYRLRANKIFISAGEHDLSDNIVHLVLAKIRGPKLLVNDDGSLGVRNDVQLAGLFHEMGYRGSISTAMNFGEQHAAGRKLGLNGGKTFAQFLQQMQTTAQQAELLMQLDDTCISMEDAWF